MDERYFKVLDGESIRQFVNGYWSGSEFVAALRRDDKELSAESAIEWVGVWSAKRGYPREKLPVRLHPLAQAMRKVAEETPAFRHSNVLMLRPGFPMPPPCCLCGGEEMLRTIPQQIQVERMPLAFDREVGTQVYAICSACVVNRRKWIAIYVGIALLGPLISLLGVGLVAEPRLAFLIEYFPNYVMQVFVGLLLAGIAVLSFGMYLVISYRQYVRSIVFDGDYVLVRGLSPMYLENFPEYPYWMR